MRESQAQTSMAVLILACHLVVEGGIIQKKKKRSLSELEIEEPAKMTGLTRR